MTNTPPQKQRDLTSIELSKSARGALRRIKKLHGMTLKAAVEKGINLLEQTLKSTPRGI